MENPIIKIENLCFSYEAYDDTSVGTPNLVNSIPALKNINLSINKGEYVAILGHNGSGKSTLAKLLNMILIPSLGKIYIDGKDITNPLFTEEDVFEVRKDVGMVFQNPDNQLVATLVEEDVAFGPENLGLPREEIRRRVNNSLALVDMLDYLHHAPHKLSGGQKQRIAIAGIIAMKPKIIIFDESTAMLDPLGRKEVVAIMEKLNREEGITVLNITHYMDEAARADRVIVINDGELVLDGTAKDVFSRVDELHLMGLEAPQGVELIHQLSKEGYMIDKNVLSESECTEAILNFLKGKSDLK
jgi:energy-coupling factor transport system ATP-binding protein